MGDREKWKGTEPHPLDPRIRVEDGIEHQVTGLVHHQPQPGPGKKLHTVEHAMLMRYGSNTSFNGRGGLRRRDNRQNCCGKQRKSQRAATAEYGTPVALSCVRAKKRNRKLED